MTSLYRREKNNILNSEFRDREILPLSETFDAESFRVVLSNPECKSLRIYLGMNEDLKVRVITVGVNEKGEELLEGEQSILEEGATCPPLCPPPPPPPTLNYD